MVHEVGAGILWHHALYEVPISTGQIKFNQEVLWLMNFEKLTANSLRISTNDRDGQQLF